MRHREVKLLLETTQEQVTNPGLMLWLPGFLGLRQAVGGCLAMMRSA